MRKLQPLTAEVKMALEFATNAHEGQFRKYTNEPYIVHPIAVANLLRRVYHTEEMLIAALLHDTVEDTPVTLDDIRAEFGDDVATLVHYLTEKSVPEDGNRAVRKEIDALHYAEGDWRSQTIKVADLIDNTRSIKKHDPDF